MFKDSHMVVVQKHGVLVARIIIGAFFLIAGVNKLTGIAGTAGYIESVGLPAPILLAWAAAVLETLLGAALIIGRKIAESSLILAVFVLIINFTFHAPGLWESDPMQQTLFMKNLAILAGLLLLIARVPARKTTQDV